MEENLTSLGDNCCHPQSIFRPSCGREAGLRWMVAWRRRTRVTARYVLGTKRAGRMAEVLERRFPEGIPPYLAAVVSAEDQATADERLPICPASGARASSPSKPGVPWISGTRPVRADFRSSSSRSG